MGSGKTNDYDLVIELAEDPIVALLGDAIDASGSLSSMFGGDDDVSLIWRLGGLDSEFSFDVSFDRDNAVLNPAQTNAIDVRLSTHLSLGATGLPLLSWDVAMDLRWVVGAAVERRPLGSGSQDVPIVDFTERLYHSSLEIESSALNMAIAALAALLPGVSQSDLQSKWDDFEAMLKNRMDSFLRDDIGKLPIAFPMPVTPGSDDPGLPISMDLKTIGDTSSSPNALALLVTFGDGTAGSTAAFTESFLESASSGDEDPAELAWAMLDFLWIGRLIAAKLKETDVFSDASFEHERNGAVAVTRLADKIEVDDGVWLDSLSLTFDPSQHADRFTLRGKVAKRGFCYEASADVGGTVTIAVDEPDPESGIGGTIRVDGIIEDPDVDLDIPWYCWVLGILTFGALFGPVGVIIAVTIGLIVEAIEGVFDWIADEVVEALNGLTDVATLPTGQLKLKPIDAFIDDASLIYDVNYEGLAPIRCEGIALLRNGQGLELDNGKVVSGADLPSTDLRFIDGALELGCAAEMAKLPDTHFDRQLRFMLYDQDYQRPLSFGIDEYTQLDTVGSATLRTPSLKLCAVRSDEDRYSLIQVVAVNERFIRVRYRTWERPIRDVRIDGDFVCRRAFVPGTVGTAVFQPARDPDTRPRPKSGCGCTDPVLPQGTDRDRTTGDDRGAPAYPANVTQVSMTHAMTVAPAATSGGGMPLTPCFRSKLRDEHERAQRFRELARLAAMSGESSIGQAFVQRDANTRDVIDLDPSVGALIHQSRLPQLSASAGRWQASVSWQRQKSAIFRAIETGVMAATRREWRVDGERLEGADGVLDIPGNQLKYAIREDGRELELELRDATETAFSLSVEVEEGAAPRLSAARCVRFSPVCEKPTRVMPRTLAQARMMIVPGS